MLNDLYEEIKLRKTQPREGSYTNYLFDKGLDKILKKVGEEATEVVIAAKNDNQELIAEVSDLAYHLLVLLAEKYSISCHPNGAPKTRRKIEHHSRP